MCVLRGDRGSHSFLLFLSHPGHEMIGFVHHMLPAMMLLGLFSSFYLKWGEVKAVVLTPSLMETPSRTSPLRRKSETTGDVRP